MKRSDINILIAVSLVLFAVVARTVNNELHLYNFAPIAAMGLFTGSIIKDKKWLACLIPLAGQFLADVYFQYFTSTPGFYPGQFFNYAALLSAALLGLSMKNIKPANTLAYIFGASTLFFVISNFGYFASGFNGYTFTGLQKTYLDAIPFYKNTIVGDLLGGVVFYGIYFVAQNLLAKKAQKINA